MNAKFSSKPTIVSSSYATVKIALLVAGGILISSLISYAIYQKVVQNKRSEKKQ
jgi:hypothetical protein